MSLFGTLPDGRPVHCLELAAGDLTVSVLTWGAILQDARLLGRTEPLTLGAETLAAYLGPMAFCGAIVGPVANRIAGAEAPLDGRSLHLVATEGPNTLHGGRLGTHARLWSVAGRGPDWAELALDLTHGDEGYPGNRRITARFATRAPAVLDLELTATTDAPTLMNLANHSYWCLGPSAAGLAGHRLQIAADSYTPVDDALIPTGTAPVEGTPFDFRQPQPIGTEGTPLDHNFCLAPARRPLAFAARLTGPDGLSLTVETTEPGLQVYDGARLATAPHPGLAGAPYGAHAGVAIEAQAWPDAPNHPDFPQIRLYPGQTYRQHTRWSFSR